jgi:hypothetical protein
MHFAVREIIETVRYLHHPNRIHWISVLPLVSPTRVHLSLSNNEILYSCMNYADPIVFRHFHLWQNTSLNTQSSRLQFGPPMRVSIAVK